MNRFPNWVCAGSVAVDGDLLNVFGFYRWKRHGDPLNARPPAPKRQILELCGLGEVKRRHPRHIYVCT